MERQHVYHEGYPLEGGRLPVYYRLMRTRIVIFLWIIGIIAFSFLPCLYLPVYFMPFYLIGVIGHVSARIFANWAVGSWFYFACLLFRFVLGIRVRIFGHRQPLDKRTLIILNHRCHFDWMFLWLVLAKVGDLGMWTVILKKLLKPVPLAGWAMQYHNFIFLSRRWGKDERELEWKLNYLRDTDTNYQFLIFPEGTDLTPEHKVKSDEYAITNNLPHFHYCLHPKAKGFLYTMKLLRQSKIESIYDMTVGYPDALPRTEEDFLMKGCVPVEVHYHITRYDISQIPQSDDGLEEWLRKRWLEKEEQLRLFYIHRCFMEKNETNNGFNNIGQNAACRSLVKSPEVVAGFPWGSVIKSMLFLLTLNVVSYLWCSYSWWGIIAGCFSAFVQHYVSCYQDGLDYFIMEFYRKKFRDFLPEDKKNA